MKRSVNELYRAYRPVGGFGHGGFGHPPFLGGVFFPVVVAGVLLSPAFDYGGYGYPYYTDDQEYPYDSYSIY
ncbi:hypothetical protein CON65_13335 [Bacillus pseudomycoides]|uniref:Uncharacterized protein n=1 Tax=Bacillus pseudomycoides TaxID=64104 RepID=A0AA91ZU17_9BACI|nr:MULTISPECIES: hypothetical protein [Bacillus]PEB55970.1 hypothetical protein COO03_02090 [Bacillus sp. AFS098217]PED82193.1 hypothetical protein CON65_13335 [Bacillus pseudomycoides]PEU17956.1 hypothetical protein CN524_00675 [Bacillus sp. AFS019443]PEU19920.1 hypothetical protein CN525_05570 [Bacillus sp. AFS014408]PFW60484.1 hypothetical protein COL20_21660 [Bacillus sp. AFS075034]